MGNHEGRLGQKVDEGKETEMFGCEVQTSFSGEEILDFHRETHLGLVPELLNQAFCAMVYQMLTASQRPDIKRGKRYSLYVAFSEHEPEPWQNTDLEE